MKSFQKLLQLIGAISLVSLISIGLYSYTTPEPYSTSSIDGEYSYKCSPMPFSEHYSYVNEEGCEFEVVLVSKSSGSGVAMVHLPTCTNPNHASLSE